jgi:5-methyltetrahydropteroyltriglutamate--homocysteine methyltransferase
MNVSTDRILTTHVGSLPRSPAVVDLLFKRERGEAYDRAEFDGVMAEAVFETVRAQVEMGIDIVSDGETSKIGYATYIKDRLTGFDGDNPRQIALDLQDYPDFRARMAVFAGKQTFKRQSCVGPIRFIGADDLERDIARMCAALARHGAHEGFMNAASPGVVSAFQPNRCYSTHAAYVEAIGEAMRIEYEAIAGAGLVLQLDCPDLAMARHTGFQDLTESEFLKRAEHQVLKSYQSRPGGRITRHVCTNIRITVESSETARGLTYATLYSANANDAPEAHFGIKADPRQLVGEFEDEFVRTAEGWRFAARRARFVLHTQ